MNPSSHLLDTQMMLALKTLLTERSVTRTAVRLNQSQPAVSATLRRLRTIFGDELLVRSGNAMVPTARALELERSLWLVLEEIDRMFAGSDAFEPATTPQTFNVGCPDYLTTVFVAGVAQVMRREAPSARLTVHPLGPDYDFERAMAHGEMDVVIGNWPQPPEQLHMAPLLTDDIVCLMWREHPLAQGALTQAQYLAAPHVVPLPFSSTHRGVIDQHLASLRLSRSARVTVPFFSMAPHMLPGTDLIFTISRHFANHYAAMLPLAVVPCPIDYPPMRFYQLWHPRAHHAPAQRWLRQVLAEVAQRILLPTRALDETC
ncbi:MAG: DNA-binding transcriptional regulator, LysR family [Variovorax sp.]|nr:DNA-binding transcriptional regulator, LysR family [Variovorax sp.]